MLDGVSFIEVIELLGRGIGKLKNMVLINQIFFKHPDSPLFLVTVSFNFANLIMNVKIDKNILCEREIIVFYQLFFIDLYEVLT